MKKVGIAELKARLSERLREVRRGHSLTILDRNTPIARIVPYAPEGEPLLVDEMEVVEPTGIVLRRAAAPLPTPLGTLGAIHLTTGLLWSERKRQDLVMATHDAALARAARASGLRVVGV